MGIRNKRFSRDTLAQAGLFVVASTIALTASFLGIVGLMTGEVTGLTTRLPFYVLLTAIAFVASIVIFEEEYREGAWVLQLSVLLSATTLILATFGGEGMSYLYQNQEQVVTSQLIFYILSAGLIGTGICYWALQHRSELTRAGVKLGT
jgi:hypothetical protein